MQSASTAEAFSLTGDNLYNPAWGWQGSEQRSARIRRSQQPLVQITHAYVPDDGRTLTTTLSARFGRDGSTDLNWQNAPNPRPDYYRHLPSFLTNPAARERLAELWRTDPSVSQIDWSELVNFNANAGPAAHYILENRVREYREAALHSTLQWELAPGKRITAGVRLFGADNRYYKELDDLLGGSYWLDIDAFAENIEDTRNGTHNNLLDPDRQVGSGDRFGYNYALRALSGEAFLAWSHRRDRWEYSVGGRAGGSGLVREGFYEKEGFEGDASLGTSPWSVAPDWGLHGGVGYRLGGRLRADVQLGVQSLAVPAQNRFSEVEYRNALIEAACNERAAGGELRLDYRTPSFRLYGAGFYTCFLDGASNQRFYDDLNGYFCTYSMQGLDARHAGIELGFEVELAAALWLKGAGVWSDNRYTSDPTAREERESNGAEVLTEQVGYRGLHVPGSPQQAGVVELSYAPRGWIAAVTLSGFGGSYVAPAPLRRTARAAEGVASDEELAGLTVQERLAGGAVCGLFLGHTFQPRNSNSRWGVYGGVQNLFNRRDLTTGGYESQRIRGVGEGAERHLQPLDTKYYHAPGITFFLTASWRFFPD